MKETIELIKYLTPAISIVAVIIIIVIKFFEFLNSKLKSSERIKLIDKDIVNINKMNSLIEDLTYYGQESVRNLLYCIKDGQRLHTSDIDNAIKILKKNKAI